MAPANAPLRDPNSFLEVMDALSNRHGQVDIRLDRLSMKLPFAFGSLELNGTVTVSVHMRDLTDKERSAHIAKQLRNLSG